MSDDHFIAAYAIIESVPAIPLRPLDAVHIAVARRLAAPEFAPAATDTCGTRPRSPAIAALSPIFNPADAVDGRRVVFTSSDALTLRARLAGRRSPNLLRELPTPTPADKEPAS
jgi:hypothetical protein